MILGTRIAIENQGDGWWSSSAQVLTGRVVGLPAARHEASDLPFFLVRLDEPLADPDRGQADRMLLYARDEMTAVLYSLPAYPIYSDVPPDQETFERADLWGGAKVTVRAL